MISRYGIQSSLDYDYSGFRAVGRELIEEDGKYVLFTDHQREIDSLIETAWRDAATIAMLEEKIRLLCGGLP